jgi:hypothetical protein
MKRSMTGIVVIAFAFVIPSEVEESLFEFDKVRDVSRPSHKAMAWQATSLDLTKAGHCQIAF